MSKHHKNYRPQTPTMNNTNVVNNEVVPEGVAPVEGVDSIDETNEEEVVVTTDSEETVSVADTQESINAEEEDGSATILEETVEVSSEPEEEVKEEPIKEEVIPQVEPTPAPPVEQKIKVDNEPKKEEVIPQVVTTVEPSELKENSYYVDLGVVETPEKMDIVKERLVKAGFTSPLVVDGNLVIGPFDTEAECIKARKAIVGKGLKGRIIEK